MGGSGDTSSFESDVRNLLRKLKSDDPGARDQLVERCMNRVRALTHARLRNYPGVARWEQPDDVTQVVMTKLHRALASVRPESPLGLMRFCAALIRRELIDLHRKYFGPEGLAAHYASPAPTSASSKPRTPDREDSTFDPVNLAEWAQVHEVIATLPDDHREIFDLLLYQELTHGQAAVLLGVSEKTVQRRWRAARLALMQALEGEAR